MIVIIDGLLQLLKQFWIFEPPIVQRTTCGRDLVLVVCDLMILFAFTELSGVASHEIIILGSGCLLFVFFFGFSVNCRHGRVVGVFRLLVSDFASFSLRINVRP